MKQDVCQLLRQSQAPISISQMYYKIVATYLHAHAAGSNEEKDIQLPLKHGFKSALHACDHPNAIPKSILVHAICLIIHLICSYQLQYIA